VKRNRNYFHDRHNMIIFLTICLSEMIAADIIWLISIFNVPRDIQCVVPRERMKAATTTNYSYCHYGSVMWTL
jgi:hypothetical protein